MKSLSPVALLRRLSPPSSSSLTRNSPVAPVRKLSHLAHSTPTLATQSFTPLTTPLDHSPHMLYSNHQPVAQYVSQTCAAESNNVSTVRSYLRAREQGNSSQLSSYYSDTFQQIESPTNPFSLLLSTPGTFSRQRLLVKNIAEVGEQQVIVDIQWHGTLARAFHTLEAGDELSGRTLVWFHLESGKITKQANFHCVNPSF